MKKEINLNKMAKFFDHSDFENNRRGRKRVVDKELKIGPVSIRFITIALITILSIIYLTQSNASATKGYELKALQKKEEELSLENERLEVEASRLKSLKRIEKTAEKKNMEEIKDVEYVE